MSSLSVRNAVRVTAVVIFLSLAFATVRHANETASQSAASQQSARTLDEDVRITAASLFTSRYAQSRMAGWDVRASAAGSDCSVLFIRVSVIMEDSMVEAMHYGSGAYDVYEGGVQQFYRQRLFRGVIYKDASGRIWTFGAVSRNEADGLTMCGSSSRR